MAYPSLVHLSGSVEIKTSVCVQTTSAGQVCDGYVVVRAEKAELHTDTGQIEASGNVRVTRERSGDVRLQ